MASIKQSYTAQLAHFISCTQFENLPTEVVTQAKLLILDVLGCAMSGFSHDRGRISRKVAVDLSGKAEATIVGKRDKASCVSSAYANSNMASSLDNEETFMNAWHFSSNTVFPALALAERENVSGKDLITAVAIGYESAARIGLSTGYSNKVVDGKLLSYPVQGDACWQSMASVAAACSTVRLSEDKTFHALGIQGHYSPAPSSYLWVSSPNVPLIKYWDNGWMAAGGIVSTLLASEGYTSYFGGILDGKHGFWKMYGAESCEFDIITQELGNKWWLLETSFKPWPSCRWTHHPLTAISQIMEKHDVKPDDVGRVQIEGSLMWRLPHFRNQTPKGPISPQFSAAHAVAMFMLGIPPGVDWYRPEIVDSTRVDAFRQKVTLEIDPEFISRDIVPQISKTPRVVKKIPTTVKIFTDQHVYEESVLYAKGDPWDIKFRMSGREVGDKFRLNASSLQPASIGWREKIEQIIDVCLNLEKVKSVRELTVLLSPET